MNNNDQTEIKTANQKLQRSDSSCSSLSSLSSSAASNIIGAPDIENYNKSESSKHEQKETQTRPRRNSELSLRSLRPTDSYSQYPDQANLEQLSRQASRKSLEQHRLSITSDSIIPEENTISIEATPIQSEVDEKYDDAYEVKIGYNDVYDMTRLPYWRKWVITIVLAMTGLVICMLSSCWSLASENLQKEFNVSHEETVLGISLFIWAMGIGPLFLSPISEYYGRKVTYVFGISLSIVFQVLTAFTKNYGGMLFGRFMSGFFGAAFLSVAPGTISDIFEKSEIGVPLSVYSLSPFLGPSLGPLVSGFINQYASDYRWTFYSIIIACGVLLVTILLVVPETYRPLLLISKAKEIRNATGDDKYYAPLERIELTLFESIFLCCRRPLLVLMKDPMMTVLCFYSGLVLAIVYLFFISIPYTFRTVYGFNTSQQGMAFLGLTVGFSLPCLFSVYFSNLYNKLSEKNGQAEPEYRFPSLMIGSIVAPISLFIMAWTCFKQAHWIGTIIASALYGLATAMIITGIFTYTADAYRLYAASAVAANTFTRCMMAGIFPLFGLQLYQNLGVHWATTLLAFLALLIAPVPFIFYKKGKILRSKSPYAWCEK